MPVMRFILSMTMASKCRYRLKTMSVRSPRNLILHTSLMLSLMDLPRILRCLNLGWLPPLYGGLGDPWSRAHFHSLNALMATLMQWMVELLWPPIYLVTIHLQPELNFLDSYLRCFRPVLVGLPSIQLLL